MNSKILIAFVAVAMGLLLSKASLARDTNHKVVIEVVSSDPEQWGKLMNNIENIQEALRKVTIEVVAHGEGLSLLVKTNNPPIDRMAKAAANGVKFSACKNTMKNKKITRSHLLDFVETVDSGVAEVIRKQEDHWAYLRN